MIDADQTPPSDVAQLRALAERLLQQGRAAEAAEAFQRLLLLDPHQPDAWYNLAYLQHHTRRFDDALASYREALNRGVSGAEEVHVNRAVILADHLSRHDEAEAELRAALAIQPAYVPALVNLANLHEQRGDRSRAIERYEEALALEPGCAMALARLPHLVPAQTAEDPLITRLRGAIAGARAAERADLGFALGKALDDAGAYDEAFAAYQAANDASRAAGGGTRYDAEAHQRSIDSLIAAFPHARAAPAIPATSGRRLIFICGMFRSGSTLVERILGSHPEVTAGGELDLLPGLVRQRFGPPPQIFSGLDAATLQHWRAHYLQGCASMFPCAACLTDKRPDNFLNIGLIKELFPDAVIVHTRRHPLDNCLSIYFLHLAHSMPHALDLQDTAHWYRQYERLMAHWKSVHGDDIHDVDYDTLVANPRPVLEALLAHCGLPWSDRCLAFHESGGVVSTPSGWQVRRPLYTESSGRWRHYARHLANLRAALGDSGGAAASRG
ncbi:MAG TPA: sulfotransferase [Aquabacterium sp.]|nr:sulfotransferase [Aquabacterium sp.]